MYRQCNAPQSEQRDGLSSDLIRFIHRRESCTRTGQSASLRKHDNGDPANKPADFNKLTIKDVAFTTNWTPGFNPDGNNTLCEISNFARGVVFALKIC